MRRALWLDDLPDFDPLTTSLAVDDDTETRNRPVTSDSVGLDSVGIQWAWIQWAARVSIPAPWD